MAIIYLLVILFIGWPAVIASLYLMASGIRNFRPRAALAGALLSTPFLVYLSGSGRFRIIALLVVLLNCFAVPWALAHRRRSAAVACTAPYVALVMTVAWFVIRSRV